MWDKHVFMRSRQRCCVLSKEHFFLLRPWLAGIFLLTGAGPLGEKADSEFAVPEAKDGSQNEVRKHKNQPEAGPQDGLSSKINQAVQWGV